MSIIPPPERAERRDRRDVLGFVGALELLDRRLAAVHRSRPGSSADSSGRLDRPDPPRVLRMAAGVVGVGGGVCVEEGQRTLPEAVRRIRYCALEPTTP